jgi:DNA-binding NarL/FixJ family response regulator
MPARSICVLLAEDYLPFRRFLASTMQSRPELQIICEVEDGAEAVQKAAALQPELVVLDIGLPSLNGIEAARQIRKLSPNSKLLFVSQESSADIVQAAIETGANGYVVKADAGRELIAALDSVLRGQTYLSKSLAVQKLTNVQDKSAVHPVEDPNVLEARGQPGLTSSRRHEVGLYWDDGSLVEAFAHFVAEALKNGNTAILIATQAHRETVLGRLHALGWDVNAAIEQGRYVELDNAETVSTYMVNDLPDPAQFSKVTCDLIERTAKSVGGEYARIAACGECAPLLLARGNPEGAIRLEQLWDEIARSYGVQVLCGYPQNSFQDKTSRQTFERICTEHSAVLSR